MARWGIWGIALMYLLAGMAVPWPIEIPLWLSGDLMHRGQAGYWDVVLVTWVGTAVGNIIAFAIARIGGRSLLRALSHQFHLERQVAQTQDWIDRYGLRAVVFTRWINWGFGLAVWSIGFSTTPAYVVLPTMVINAAVWSCAWAALAGVLVRSMYQVGLPGWFVLLPGGVLLVVMGIWQGIGRLRPSAEPVDADDDDDDRLQNGS